MRISELVFELVELYIEHGDVEVYTEDGCGCCIGSRAPQPEFCEADKFYGYEYMNAVAL